MAEGEISCPGEQPPVGGDSEEQTKMEVNKKLESETDDHMHCESESREIPDQDTSPAPSTQDQPLAHPVLKENKQLLNGSGVEPSVDITVDFNSLPPTSASNSTDASGSQAHSDIFSDCHSFLTARQSSGEEGAASTDASIELDETGSFQVGRGTASQNVTAEQDCRVTSEERDSSTDTLTQSVSDKLRFSDSQCHPSHSQQYDSAVGGCSDQSVSVDAPENPGSMASSVSDKEAFPEQDSVHISRADLTHMVEQTLAAQTMCAYIQELVNQNSFLSHQNEALLGSIAQSGVWEVVAEKLEKFQSLPAKSEGQIFRFDCFPSQAHSMPVTLDQSEGSSGYSSSHTEPVRDPASRTSLGSIPSADGESVAVSGSLQLSSNLCLDGVGDGNHRAKTGHEASGTLNDTGGRPFPLTITGNEPYSGAAVSAQDFPANIPNILDSAISMSDSRQQAEENLVGSAGVVCESVQHKIFMDEHEKMRRFVHKISSDCGVSPNSMSELFDLREKLQQLKIENASLKTELENYSAAQQTDQRYPVISDLNKKLEQARVRENELLGKMGKLAKEVKQMRAEKEQEQQNSRPISQSQPSSSLGLQALQHIPATMCKECQTTASAFCENSGSQTEKTSDRNQVDDMKQQLWLYQQEVASLKNKLHQAQHSEKAIEKMKIEVSKTSTDNMLLQQEIQRIGRMLQEKTTHCSELADQIVKFDDSNEKLTKALTQEKNRNKELDHMLTDERKRYSRDEKQLLDRVRLLTTMAQDREVFKKLVLAVETARQNQAPLPADIAEQVAALLHHRRQGGANADSRSASPRRGATPTRNHQPGGSPTAGRHTPPPHHHHHHHASPSRQGAGNAGSPSRSGHAANIHGSVHHHYQRHGFYEGGAVDSRGPVSLPPTVSGGVHSHQHTEGASSNDGDGGRSRGLQRNNLAGSVPSVASPQSTSKQHRHL